MRNHAESQTIVNPDTVPMKAEGLHTLVELDALVELGPGAGTANSYQI